MLLLVTRVIFLSTFEVLSVVITLIFLISNVVFADIAGIPGAISVFFRVAIDAIGRDIEDSLCVVLKRNHFLLNFHGFQCFKLLGMFSAFVVGRSLAFRIKFQLTNIAGGDWLSSLR